MGNRMAVNVSLQRQTEAAEQVHLVSGAAFLHGFHLISLIRDKSTPPGKLLQHLAFPDDAFCQGAEVFCCFCRILVGTGNQQCIQLCLGCRDGYDLYNIFSLGVRPHGWTAANARMAVCRCSQGKPIEQRRNTWLFRQCDRLLIPCIIYENYKNCNMFMLVFLKEMCYNMSKGMGCSPIRSGGFYNEQDCMRYLRHYL